MILSRICKQIYFKTTGYSYTNLGRMFLRLFVGLMLMQFGVRSIIGGGADLASAGGLFSLDKVSLVIAIIEIFCSFCIMIGFLTRVMIIPLFVLMIIFCHCGFHADPTLGTGDAGSVLPFMFLGIYFFLLLVGPGKISVDYFFALYLIGKEDGNEVFELEEV